MSAPSFAPPAAAVFGLCVLLLTAALVLLLALRRRYTVVVVRGPSMTPTLQPGDRLLARRIGGGSVKVGDIVVLRVPADVPDRRTGEMSSTVVKRVAAVAGDPLPLVPDAGPASGCDRDRELLPPPGHLTVLGDNRSASVDSRVWGPIGTDRVLAKVIRTL
jgi:signal peptidase I